MLVEPVVAVSPQVLVVDASAALKLVLPEPGSEVVVERLEAEVDAGTDLVVPELFWVEVANTLWKRTRYRDATQRISVADARMGFAELQVAAFRSEPVRPLSGWALEISLDLGVAVYDSLYLALAERHDARWITTDAVAAARLTGSKWGSRIELLS